MNEAGKSFLKFNGHVHHLNQVVAKARTAPTITVAKGDIHLDEGLPVGYSNYTSDETELIIFYKHDGRYLVLLGRELVRKAMSNGHLEFIGRLMSSPMLKTTRVADQAPSTANLMQPSEVRRNPAGFENRPHFKENRTSQDRPRSNPAGALNRRSQYNAKP